MTYIRQSMSVNAAIAYNSGEKPRSQWTKTEILMKIAAGYLAGVQNGLLNIYYNKEKSLRVKQFMIPSRIIDIAK